MSYYEIYDNLETTLAASFDPGSSNVFYVPTADIPALLYTDSSIDVIFAISDGTETLFVSCYPTSEAAGQVEFTIHKSTGLGAALSTIYPIGSTVKLSNSRAAVIQAATIGIPGCRALQEVTNGPNMVRGVGNYSTCGIDQTFELAHRDIIFADLVIPDNNYIIPVIRKQAPYDQALVPRTINVFVRQSSQGIGDYSGVIYVTTAQGDVAVTPIGTGPTTVNPVKLLRATAIGIPSSDGWVTVEWLAATQLDLSEGGGGE